MSKLEASGFRGVQRSVVFSLLLGAPQPAGAQLRAVVLYHGFGTESGGARIQGRVRHPGGLRGPAGPEGLVRRLARNVQLLRGRGVGAQEVEVKVLGHKHRVASDDRGYFELRLDGPLPAGTWTTRARLAAASGRGALVLRRRLVKSRWWRWGKRTARRVLPWSLRRPEGKLSVWPDGPGLVVISDIDDTVLVSGAQNPLMLVWRSLSSNWRTMKSVPGAAGTLRRLSASGTPVMFLSDTPLSLYTRIRRFVRGHDFPDAPLVLKNLGQYALLGRQHKIDQIGSILERLPQRKAVLIGDSGQHDPEVYGEICNRMPQRVAQVLIRQMPRGHALQPGQIGFTDWKEAEAALRKKGILPGAVP